MHLVPSYTASLWQVIAELAKNHIGVRLAGAGLGHPRGEPLVGILDAILNRADILELPEHTGPAAGSLLNIPVRIEVRARTAKTNTARAGAVERGVLLRVQSAVVEVNARPLVRSDLQSAHPGI